MSDHDGWQWVFIAVLLIWVIIHSDMFSDLGTWKKKDIEWQKKLYKWNEDKKNRLVKIEERLVKIEEFLRKGGDL